MSAGNPPARSRTSRRTSRLHVAAWPGEPLLSGSHSVNSRRNPLVPRGAFRRAVHDRAGNRVHLRREALFERVEPPGLGHSVGVCERDERALGVRQREVAGSSRKQARRRREHSGPRPPPLKLLSFHGARALDDQKLPLRPVRLAPQSLDCAGQSCPGLISRNDHRRANRSRCRHPSAGESPTRLSRPPGARARTIPARSTSRKRGISIAPAAACERVSPRSRRPTPSRLQSSTTARA